MTRFTDRVERDLDQIADRATLSTTAWEAVQQRIVKQGPESTMEVIMLSPDNKPTNRSRIWLLAAASVAVFVMIGGAIALTRNDAAQVVADAPTTTLTTPDESVAPATTATTAAAPTTTAGATTASSLLSSKRGPLDAGTYLAARGPVPFTFTLPEGWEGYNEAATDLAVGKQATGKNLWFSFLEGVTFFRTRADDDAATVADELVAIEAASLVSAPDTEVGGFPAVVLEGQYDESVGLELPPLFPGGAMGSVFRTIGESRYRIQLVDTPKGLLIIWTEAGIDAFAAWTEEADAVIDTVTFQP